MLTFRSTTFLFFLLLLISNLLRFAGYDPGYFTLVLVLLYLVIPVILAFFPCSGYHHRPVICHGIPGTPSVALTFDDGPDPQGTPVILDILAKHHVKATFFLKGKEIERHPELVRRIFREGHLCGNHSYSHGNFWAFLPPGKMAAEIDLTNRLIESVTGTKPLFFRPPYGVINPMVHWALKRSPLKVVLWNRRSYDTILKDPGKVLQRVLPRLSPGDILVFHDTSATTRELLDLLIGEIRRKELRPVRLDELLNNPSHA